MRLIFTFLLLILSMCSLCAQDKSKLAFLVKAHPMAIVNPDRPSLIGSCELLFFDKVGIEMGYGRRYTDNFLFENADFDTLSVKAGGETKFIDLIIYNSFTKAGLALTEDSNLNTYAGLSYRFFNDITNERIHYFSHKISGIQSSKVDYYAKKRIVHIFVLKGGFIFKLKPIIMECYAEAGVRHKNQTLINNEFDPENDLFPEGLWPWERPFEAYLPTLNVGVKVSYRLLNIR